jgi:ribonuclease D
MSITLHQGDLPAGLDLGPVIAVDTETMGLKPGRDALCVVQLSAGDGTAHVVKLGRPAYDAPNLKALMADTNRLKIFHNARFDHAMLRA